MMDLIFDTSRIGSYIQIEGRQRPGVKGVFVYDFFIFDGQLLALQRFRYDVPERGYADIARVWRVDLETLIRREFDFDIDDPSVEVGGYEALD